MCDPRDEIAREVCFTGRYEAQDTALTRAILLPNMTFVGVGANWGYFILLAAHLAGTGGRVISLEPHPRLFGLLSESVSRSRLSQAVALNIAATDKPGSAALAGFDERGAIGAWPDSAEATQYRAE